MWDKKIHEAVSVFWDGFLEGSYHIDQFEDWMSDTNLPGTQSYWRYSLAKLFPEKHYILPIHVPIGNDLWRNQITHLDGTLALHDPSVIINTESIRSIEGDLYIQMNNIHFGNIRSIEGDLYTQMNNIHFGNSSNFYDSYVPYPGKELYDQKTFFISLEKIGGSLEIKDNSNLFEIPLFQNLIEIENNLIIEDNSNLSHIDSFHQLRHLGGCIIIAYNSKLKEINGLEKIKHVHRMVINKNPQLNTLIGFNKLKTVYGDLAFTQNGYLKTIDAFNDLQHISVNLIIQSEAITNIPSFDSLKEVGSFHIRVPTPYSESMSKFIYKLETHSKNFESRFHLPMTPLRDEKITTGKEFKYNDIDDINIEINQGGDNGEVRPDRHRADFLRRLPGDFEEY